MTIISSKMKKVTVVPFSQECRQIQFMILLGSTLNSRKSKDPWLHFHMQVRNTGEQNPWKQPINSW